MRRGVRPKVQPGKILSRLCRQSSQAAENRKRTEKEVLCGQLGAEKSLIYKALQDTEQGQAIGTTVYPRKRASNRPQNTI